MKMKMRMKIKRIVVISDLQVPFHDKKAVNNGFSSTRGGKMASYMYSADGMTSDRMLYPRFYAGLS